jgi:hypothetical protein
VERDAVDGLHAHRVAPEGPVDERVPLEVVLPEVTDLQQRAVLPAVAPVARLVGTEHEPVVLAHSDSPPFPKWSEGSASAGS